MDPLDRGAIAAALRRLVREPALRERLGAGSLAVTARHPLEADAEAFERAVLTAAALGALGSSAGRTCSATVALDRLRAGSGSSSASARSR